MVVGQYKIPLLNHQNGVETTVSAHARKRQHKRLRIASVYKYVLSTMDVSKESISKFLIGNWFHVKLRILSPENCKQSLRVKSWKAEVTAERKHTRLQSKFRNTSSEIITS